MVFKKILVGLDNSSFSGACSDAALALASAFGAEVAGCHVYAAGLHRRRFRQMEASLPEEYLGDAELRRQRAIHSKLIDLGLRLISESYLDSLAQRCAAVEVPFTKKTFDGRNWQRLVEEVNGSSYDLVVLGARGHGTTREDAVGSVCLRLLRHTRTDCLVIKDAAAWADAEGPIVVALDGSQEAFGALRAAVALGKAFRRPVQAVAAYDPNFHYAVFRSMVQVLSQEAAKVFRYQEQEQLHERIIDGGLGRLYRTHLELARRLGEVEGVDLKTVLLTGRAADEVLTYVEQSKPWLLLLGRIGVHSGAELDVGSVTEHVLRLAPCNLLVGSRRHSPPASLWGAEALRWTREAETALERLSPEQRQPVRLLVHRLAQEEGHTVVTSSLLEGALAELRPRPEEQGALEEAALAVAVESLRRQAGPVYLCQQCGLVARGTRPATCPGCGQDGETFLALDGVLGQLQPAGDG